jgi:chromate transporter
MAPGPNMMMITAIGEFVAGPSGALVVLVAFFLPTALLALAVGRLWTRLETWPWRSSIQRGLAPVSIGLLLAGCLIIARGAVNGLTTAFLAGAVFAILLLRKVNPAILILGGAVVGFLAFGRH